MHCSADFPKETCIMGKEGDKKRPIYHTLLWRREKKGLFFFFLKRRNRS